MRGQGVGVGSQGMVCRCEDRVVTNCEGSGHGCIRREGTSEAAPEAVRQAVGGGCTSGWGAVTVGY